MIARREIWVVSLDNLNKRNPKTDRVIVRATTKEKAIESARANSVRFRNGKSFATARIADPEIDLGMTRTPPAALRKFKIMGYV